MNDQPVQLYTYFRSSAAYRVRITLNLKRIPYVAHFVHLVKNEQRSSEYLKLNPQGFVPTLIDGDVVLTQSLAIMEYLEEKYSWPSFAKSPILPRMPEERARARQLAQIIACDIHPLNNFRVKECFTKKLRHKEEEWLEWYRYWICEGFRALEIILTNTSGTKKFCHSDAVPMMADICLVP